MKIFVYPTVLVIGLTVIARGIVAVQDSENDSNSDADFSVVKLFDYDLYKKTHGKSYNSEAEDSVRRCYFYARALAVFLSGVNYKHRYSDYFLSLNSMSDWLPEERAKTHFKGTHQMMTRNKAKIISQIKNDQPFLPVLDEQPEDTLRQFLKAHSDSAVYKDLLNQLNRTKIAAPLKAGARRRKRDVNNKFDEPRDFSFARLMGPSASTNSREWQKKVIVPSNNPFYEGIEVMTRGLSDEIETTERYKYKLPRVKKGSSQYQLEPRLGPMTRARRNSIRKRNLELGNKVFVDHRESGCINPVRKQGKCGSCYLFASTAFFEWLYCNATGKLGVEFSEQYPLDCGKGRIKNMEGCVGGTDNAAADFVHNFGLELRSKYPYVGREQTCPYDEDTNLNKTGYIRMRVKVEDVGMKHWDFVIEQTPLYIVLDVDVDFDDYGGGVHDGPSECGERESAYHAMLIVGHGREYGLEYWLIRNSHGEDWGEQGYYKLSKEVSPDCVQLKEGYAFEIESVAKNKQRKKKDRSKSKLTSESD